MKGSNEFPHPQHDLQPCPVCADGKGTNSIWKPGTDQTIRITVSGGWVTDRDAMQLNVFTSYGGLVGAYTQCSYGPSEGIIIEPFEDDQNLYLKPLDVGTVSAIMSIWYPARITYALKPVCN